MDAAQHQLSDEIDAATQRLIDEVRLLARPDLRAASRLPGWSRAHVVAHLARGADAMRNLLTGVQAGQDRPAYASAEARAAAIERSAAAEPRELADDLTTSAMALRTVARRLPAPAWRHPVRILDSVPFPAGELLTRRLVEVELHHCDLGIGYDAGHWPAAFHALELAEPMRSQRAERLEYPPSESVRAKSKARKVPPYQPGRPLPGSWIGRRPA